MKLVDFLLKFLKPEAVMVRTLRGETVIVDKRCRVCGHPQRAEIERALVNGETYEKIAEKYGLSIAGVQRHFKSHVPRLILDPAEVEKLYQERRVRQLDLQEELLKLIARLEGLFAKLEKIDARFFDAEGKSRVSATAYVQSVAERRQILQQIRETLVTIDQLKKEVVTERDISELLQKLSKK